MQLLKPTLISKKPDNEEHKFLNEFGLSYESDKTHQVLSFDNCFLITKTLGEFYIYSGKTYYYFYDKNKKLLWQDQDYYDNPTDSSLEYNNKLKVYVLEAGILTTKTAFNNEPYYEFFEISNKNKNTFHLKTKNKKMIERHLNIKLNNIKNENKLNFEAFNLEDDYQK
jgi:hypothetical protein